jgi:hypothetical protein
MAQTQYWQPEVPRASDAIEAQLNYHAYTGQRPVSYAQSLPASERREGPRPEPHRVPIRNARRASETPTLDRNGFQLVAHRSRVQSFDREEVIRRDRARPRRSIELRTLVFWDEARA